MNLIIFMELVFDYLTSLISLNEIIVCFIINNLYQ